MACNVLVDLNDLAIALTKIIAIMIDALIQSVAARARIPERRTDATDVIIPEIRPLVSLD
jgi:hypothetical protein